LKFRLTSAAEEEFAEASLYLFNESTQGALSFVDEITEAIEEVAKYPARYPVYEEDIRVKRTAIHPYSIFYQIKSDHILILSISHDSRDEAHWRNRV
jgi:plasmid stabilization system protein ParE